MVWVQFRCPQCGSLAEIDDSAGVQTAACPGCGSHVVVRDPQLSKAPPGPSSLSPEPPSLRPPSDAPSDAERDSPAAEAPHVASVASKEEGRVSLRPIPRTDGAPETLPDRQTAERHRAAADERAKRRARRNLVMGLAGAAILFLLLAILLKFSG